jgi:hypothetical protein
MRRVLRRGSNTTFPVSFLLRRQSWSYPVSISSRGNVKVTKLRSVHFGQLSLASTFMLIFHDILASIAFETGFCQSLQTSLFMYYIIISRVIISL